MGFVTVHMGFVTVHLDSTAITRLTASAYLCPNSTLIEKRVPQSTPIKERVPARIR